MSDTPDTPPTSEGDYAMAAIAHTLGIYRAALIAEKFQPHEVLALCLSYQASLFANAAAMSS